MNDAVKWCIRVIMYGTFWVFALSIRHSGQPLFYYANDVLVQNSLVRTVDESLADLYERLARAAKVAFAKNAPDDAKSL